MLLFQEDLFPQWRRESEQCRGFAYGLENSRLLLLLRALVSNEISR